MQSNSSRLSRAWVTERLALNRLVRRILGGATGGDDITHNAWVALQSVRDDPPITNIRAYLYRLVSNMAVDHLRAEKRRHQLFLSEELGADAVSSDPSVETRLIDRQRLAQLQSVVERLPPKCRQVFICIKYDELSVAETAERMAISEDMVRKHIRHALEICHAQVDRGDA